MTCKHWFEGMVARSETMCPFCEIDRLKGEHTVLINLLMAAKNVIETIDGESAEECESLMGLNNKIHYAINGAIQGLV